MFSNSALRSWSLLLPTGFFFCVLLGCSFAFLRLSFGTPGAEWTGWTLGNYAAIGHPVYLQSLGATFWLALVSAAISVLLAFPIALLMSRTTNRAVRSVLLVCVLLPMLMSVLIQSYGWIVILGPEGVVNRLLMSTGLLDRPLLFLFSGVGVLLGLVQTTIPMAVLPLASALAAIPTSLEEAAAVLGASRWRAYLHVIIPLAGPGILAASLLVFGFNTGAFVVPLLLGGLRVVTVPLHIRDQMGPLLNWPLGAALSMVLIAIALLTQVLYEFVLRRRALAASG
jgi:putative spermidine/putrescine transport system permease protein